MKTKITDELIQRCQAEVYYGNATCKDCACTEYECLGCLLEQLELEKEESE